MRSVLSLGVLALSLAVPPRAMAAQQPAPRGHDHAPKEAVVGVSSLDVYASGATIHLLTVTQAPGAMSVLEYRRSDDGGATWADPVMLGADQPPTIAKRGMDAQIAAAGDGEQLVAVWPTAGTDKMGRGPMATAVSSDGGKTWRAGPNPSDSGLSIGHSFIDIAADAAGGFHLVWLDGRDGEGKGLRYARSIDGGATWSANVTLDGDTCECCWNAFAIAPDQRVSVLYRRKSPRDMAVLSSSDAGKTWDRPVAVGAFGWSISACPHVGGAIAFADARTAHAAVWTAKDGDTHGVYVLNSRDAGTTWSAPQRVGPPEASRPDLCVDPRGGGGGGGADGSVVLVYDAYVDGGQGIFASRSTDGGKTWSAARRLSDRGATATHPRLAAMPAGPRVFWTQREPARPSTWLSAVP